MVVEAIPGPAGEPETSEISDELGRLGEHLIARGLVDHRTLDRARRVAAETGGRLDRVMTQLGMVSERGPAQALAQLVGAPLVTVADYPEAPLLAHRPNAQVLRKAHRLPMTDAHVGVVL